MTKKFNDVLMLFNNSIRGKISDISISYNAEEILSIAKSQGIWDSIFLTIKPLVKENLIKIDVEKKQELNNFFIAHYGRQQIRYALFHDLAKKINQAEISWCVLKGESVSQYYENPYTRTSSDIDVFVQPEDVQKFTDILLTNGFSRLDFSEELHHISFMHTLIGLLELHTEMYSDLDNNIVLDNLITYDEPWVEFVTEDGTIMKTLGYTDNFVFLFVHFLKHFFRRGVAIRQLTDVILYLENNYSKIDWERVNDLLDKLSFRYFFLHLVAIGEQYFDFPKDLFDTSFVKDELVEKILTDIEKGGVWGRIEEERCGFERLFFQRRYSKLYPEAKDKVKVPNRIRIFPNREFMSSRYKYVNKSVLLLPVAWIHRVFGAVIRRIKSKSVHHDRLKLLQDLNII